MSGKLGQKFRRYQGDDESEMKRNEEILMTYTWYNVNSVPAGFDVQGVQVYPQICQQ